MSSLPSASALPFIERRSRVPAAPAEVPERRQFANSHQELSAEARELAWAIDQYKFRHRRRFINYEEMLAVIHSLGYQKSAASTNG